MDRPFVYTGEVPRSADFLGLAKYAMYGVGHLAQAALGLQTTVAGLGLAPTGPASLSITVAAGSIYTPAVADASAYGVLGTDANTIVKQGIQPSPQTLTISPPNTNGYSQVFLVQAIYQDADTGVTTLPYFNSQNPLVPFAGPGGNQVQQYTIRQGLCSVGLKAGTAAPTGTQTTPAADSGYTALYAVTVANGQSQITSANWSKVGTAPFVPSLSDPQPFFHFGIDNGSANAYNLPFVTPYVSASVPGTVFCVQILNTSTGASTIALPVIGTVSLTRADGSQVRQGDLVAGQFALILWDGTRANILGLISTSTPPRNQVAITSTETWTAPFTGWYYPEVGGGGGGGGSAGNANYSGGGGGSGGYAAGWVYLVAGTQVTVTIGAGGAASANTNGAQGGSGGTTSFGSYMEATGGGGGFVGSTTCAGGTAGVGSGGQRNLYGSNGGDGNPYNSEVQGGQGAASIFGGGGRTSTITASATNGLAPCSGGGGIWHNGSANQTAGAGANGICFISY